MTLQWFRLQPTLTITGEHSIVGNLNAEHDQEQCADRSVCHIHDKVAIIGVADAIV